MKQELNFFTGEIRINGDGGELKLRTPNERDPYPPPSVFQETLTNGRRRYCFRGGYSRDPKEIVRGLELRVN